MIVKKAGCILVNLETQKVALVSRKGEFSFPKGHLEDGETLRECAIRETVEETGHNCHIEGEKEIAIIRYITPRGEDVENYLYVAIDDGISQEQINEKDKEITVWEKFNNVETTLSHDNLKKLWNEIKEEVRKIIENG